MNKSINGSYCHVAQNNAVSLILLNPIYPLFILHIKLHADTFSERYYYNWSVNTECRKFYSAF